MRTFFVAALVVFFRVRTLVVGLTEFVLFPLLVTELELVSTPEDNFGSGRLSDSPAIEFVEKIRKVVTRIACEGFLDVKKVNGSIP